MQKTLKVVCSGTGYFSQFHYEAWSRLSNVTIVGVNNRTIENAKAFAQKYDIAEYGDDLEALLTKCQPDIVDVITPPETHLASVKIAAKLGIDVICQKPFGVDLAQAEEMVAIANAANIQLIVHENFRFMPWYRKVKQLLDEKVLGDVLNVTFKLRPGDGQGPEAYLARQPYFQQMPKFLVHETAIHLVDTFRYLFGEPKNVFAKLRRCNEHIKGEDAGLILFEFPNHVEAVFDGNRLLDHQATNTRRTMGELELAGTEGELRVDGEAVITLRKFGELTRTEIPYTWQDQNFGGDCVFNTIEHIAEHYLTGSVIENQGFEYLRNIKIEQAIYQSSDEKKVVEL